MSTPIGWISLVTFLLLRSPSPPPPSEDRSFQDKLNSPVERYDIRNVSLPKAVLDLAYQYKLPTAIHHVDRALVQRPLSVALRNVSLKRVIEAVVEQAPGYRVRFSARLVQVSLPAAEEDSSNPLNTVIDDFDITNLPRQEAEIRLLGAFVSKVSPGAGYGGDTAYGPEPPVILTLHLKRAKVYEILDAIVASDGSSIWLSPPSTRSPAAVGAHSQPWVIYDLRPTTEAIALDRLDQVLH